MDSTRNLTSCVKVIILLLLCHSKLLCQNEFRKWYFGLQAGLDFSTAPPTVLTNGLINTVEGVATVCDATGNLLFYTDGTGIINSTHVVMANGAPLNGNGTSTQSGMIVKQPGNSNIYYVFTVWQNACYSIVDMNLAAGLGSVTVLNNTIYPLTSEKQVAIRHCNGKDVWVLSHEMNSNKFRAYLLTSSGLNTSPVISAIGGTLSGNAFSGAGQLKISPDGRKLAMATSTNSIPSSLGLPGYYLFDFDAATGVVSNSLTLNNSTYAYGVEFSPDGTKLYGCALPDNSAPSNVLYQWNVCAASPAAILASQYSLALNNLASGSLQRAIDGKIYMAVTGSQSISVINNPNASGAAMAFSVSVLSIAPKTSALGLPNYINSYTRPAPTPFTQTIACQTAYFSVPPVPTFSSGCSSTPYAPSSYLWDFGDTSPSSTVANAAHTFSSTGTYTVKLILYGACTNDTLKQIVTLTTPGPNPQVAGPLSICKGDRVTYTVSGGTTYNWFNNATTSTISITPSLSTVYTVSATTNGCTLSKSFSVTVNPCTAIGENNPALQDIVLYPNPVNALLTIETKQGGELSILDINGKIILQQTLSSGKHEINTEALKAGVYFIQLGKGDEIRRMKLLKLE